MNIDSPNALEKTAVYYHDQRFNLKDVSFNKKTGTFSLEFCRVIYAEAVVKKDFFIFQRIAAPVIESKLVFMQVSDMEISSDSFRDEMVKITYEPKKQEIIIYCAASSIRLKVAKLSGRLEDIGEKEDDAHEYVTILHFVEVDHGSVKIPLWR